jgi:UDP-2-acetamido-2-deoxy-ribo-hexuluronate aminotransferase
MKKIEMVDLHRQYLRHSEEINRAIQEVIDSTAFIKGPDVQLFQQELAAYMDVNHCIACGNGTDALQIAMMALDLQPGDEVITTPFTFVATIEVISLLRLKPVLVDIDPGTFNLDPSKLEQALTDRTKAIVPVHLFGQAADMNSILEFAAGNNLFIIEDNAQAIGADYQLTGGTTRKAGSLGDIGCTSFFPSKNLGAFGDGGALFTNDSDLAQRIGSIVNHGMTRRYHYDHVGVNSRLDTIQAAILRVKLKHLDEYNSARQKVAKAYDEAFSGIAELKTPQRNPDSEHIFHQYTLQVEVGRRDALKNDLNSKEIPAMIYYPVPLHLQKAYAGLGYGVGDFPIAEELSEKVLSLPMHTEMESDQLETIISAVTNFFNQ